MEDEKWRRENRRDFRWKWCLIRVISEERKWWDRPIFSHGPPFFNFPKLERKWGEEVVWWKWHFYPFYSPKVNSMLTLFTSFFFLFFFFATLIIFFFLLWVLCLMLNLVSFFFLFKIFFFFFWLCLWFRWAFFFLGSLILTFI